MMNQPQTTVFGITILLEMSLEIHQVKFLIAAMVVWLTLKIYKPSKFKHVISF